MAVLIFVREIPTKRRRFLVFYSVAVFCLASLQTATAQPDFSRLDSQDFKPG